MLTKSKDHNCNYLATIVRLENIRKHANADRLQCVSVYGNNVITGLTAKENDLYVYFPLECAISEKFLSFSNSFREPVKNNNPDQKGLFEANCRVKAVKLRGEKSEGYIVPVSELEQFCKEVLNKEIIFSDKHIGIDFDTIFDELLLKKYLPKRNVTIQGSKTKTARVEKTRLVDNQFHFHPDTAHLKREIEKISPDSLISITNKIHGCNFVVSHVLTKRKLSFLERIFSKFLKVKIDELKYDMVYSSRRVVKNARLVSDSNHFYSSDVWKIVADKIFPSLPKGFSVAGEIVGYTPEGGSIQPNYDYGCEPNELDFWVFDVRFTNFDGHVYHLSHPEMQAFCHKYGFKTPRTFYYGLAKDLFPEISTENHWHQNFLEKMMEVYLEKKCDLCKNDVWAEGIILRKMEPFEWNAFKLKSFNFLNYESKQLDSGEIDLETKENLDNIDE